MNRIELGRDPIVARERYQERGQDLVRWINDPTAIGCRIQQATLTFSQIVPLCSDYAGPMQIALAPSLVFDVAMPITPTHAMSFTLHFDNAQWIGITAPGFIIIESAHRPLAARENPGRDPYISEISLAVYARDYERNTLRSVFIDNAVNVQTGDLIRNVINSNWPANRSQLWLMGSQEYEEILGTRLGKVVAYIVLGAYPRGTHVISRIETWSVLPHGILQMRFDINRIA
ncbi:hypothetical protein N7462_009360 [Penicillium macrosclerotiorum]|uniref:uncharacterized protein n=1 Tax=Penicillium macrosclerotiorum TaxID=303699 RepID=UPI002548D793|nr:uncharacterized protein N7462_009360 [Penicillium macrosclerotiorum]KAJ5673921.1 hypothetical protein N7462_009360 [Penicillium macrosclerotiorum]